MYPLDRRTWSDRPCWDVYIAINASTGSSPWLQRRASTFSSERCLAKHRLTGGKNCYSFLKRFLRNLQSCKLRRVPLNNGLQAGLSTLALLPGGKWLADNGHVMKSDCNGKPAESVYCALASRINNLFQTGHISCHLEQATMARVDVPVPGTPRQVNWVATAKVSPSSANKPG